MKILLIDLPVHIPTMMPYSLANMHHTLSSAIDENIKTLDLNAIFHSYHFKQEYKEKNTFAGLTKFLKKTRGTYPRISKAVINQDYPLGYNLILNSILDEKPDYAVLSLVYNSQIFFAKPLVSDLKKQGIISIIGGPADYSKIKEGIILDDYEELKAYLIKKGARTLKKSRKLDFSVFNKSLYFTKDIIYPLKTAHSCPYKRCAFCTHHNNNTYHEYNLDNIKNAIIKNNIKKICFIDDCFTSLRLAQISSMLKEHKTTYWMQLRPTKKIASLLPDLYDSGLKAVCWGIESGSQKVLDKMKKGTKIEDIKKTLEISHNLGIKNQIFIMFGFPGETEDDFMSTIKFIEQNKTNIDLISYSIFGLQKNSYIYDHPKEFRITDIHHKARTILGDSITYSSDGLPHKKIIELKNNHLHLINSINKIPKVINSCKEQVLNL